MLNRKRLNKGDDVRVKFITPDHCIWHSATVVHDGEDYLHVEFASGLRQKVPHGKDRYEHVCEDA